MNTKSKSQAIEQLIAINAERENLRAEAQAINAKAAALRDQLARQETAAAVDAQAVAAATADLAAALEAGDLEGIEKARNRAAAASKANGQASARGTEINALRAAISALEDKGRPIGQRMMEIAEQEKALAGKRLDEVAAQVAQRYRDTMGELAQVVATAQALGLTAIKIDRPGNYAPPPFAMPAVVGESICDSGRVSIDLGALRTQAMHELIESLRAEGFSAGA